MLYHIGTGVVLLYLIADVSFFFLLKIIRCDLRYYLPMDSNIVSWITSFISRLIVKVVGDFTGMVYLRVPMEMGGAYWLFNQLFTMASCFVAIHLHYELEEQTDIMKSRSKDEFYTIASVIAVIWVLSFTVLLAFSGAKYRKTFYSTSTTTDFVRHIFENKNDQVKAEIFK